MSGWNKNGIFDQGDTEQEFDEVKLEVQYSKHGPVVEVQCTRCGHDKDLIIGWKEVHALAMRQPVKGFAPSPEGYILTYSCDRCRKDLENWRASDDAQQLSIQKIVISDDEVKSWYNKIRDRIARAQSVAEQDPQQQVVNGRRRRR